MRDGTDGEPWRTVPRPSRSVSVRSSKASRGGPRGLRLAQIILSASTQQEGLENASERMRVLAALKPGPYFVMCLPHGVAQQIISFQPLLRAGTRTVSAIAAKLNEGNAA
jgi:hypothetical protein